MRKIKALFFVLAVFMCLSVLKVDAANTSMVSLPLDGNVVEQEFSSSGNWIFTAPADGTITITMKSYEGTVDTDFLAKAGGSTYSLWLKSFGVIEGGTDNDSVTDSVHVSKGREYCVQLYCYGDAIARASVSATFLEDPKVTDIQLNQNQLTIEEDQNFSFAATVYPDDAADKTLKWQSSDSQIAYVLDDGRLWAVQVGQVTITAKSVDGGDVSASCVVTVIPKKMNRVNVTHATMKKIAVSWQQVEGATGYRIYKYSKSKNQFKLYKDTKNTKVNISGLSAEKSCKIKVAAYLQVGDEKYEGELSDAVTAWTAPKKVPATKIISIKKYSSKGQYNFINVTWKKVKGATGYYVYAKDAGSYKLVDTTKKTSTKLYTGRGYSYKIKVVAYRYKHSLTTNAKASPEKTYFSD